MSTPHAAVRSRSSRRSARTFRFLLAATMLFAVISTASALDASSSGSVADTAAPPAPSPEAAESPGIAVRAVESGADQRSVDCAAGTGECPDAPAAATQERSTTREDGSVEPSCRLGNPHLPEGTTSATSIDYHAPNADRLIRLKVEVEDGLAIDRECFAEQVVTILNDPRGWGADGRISFQPVDNDADLRLVLASPDLTDRLCYPLRTGGKYSCRNLGTVVLNLTRWEAGTEDYAGNLDVYRQYLVNHEVGHFLGHGHARCPGSGEPAPVMMQQTKGLEECLLNGWPTSDER